MKSNKLMMMVQIRYVENVIKYGHPGDEVIYDRQWDLFMLAPWGMFLHWEQFLYYFVMGSPAFVAIIRTI